MDFFWVAFKLTMGYIVAGLAFTLALTVICLVGVGIYTGYQLLARKFRN